MPGYQVACRLCRFTGPTGGTPDQARERALLDNWKREEPGGWLCPGCDAIQWWQEKLAAEEPITVD